MQLDQPADVRRYKRRRAGRDRNAARPRTCSERRRRQVLVLHRPAYRRDVGDCPGRMASSADLPGRMIWMYDVHNVSRLSELEFRQLGLGIACRNLDSRSAAFDQAAVSQNPEVARAKLQDVGLLDVKFERYQPRSLRAALHFRYKDRAGPARCATVGMHHHIAERLCTREIFLQVNAAIEAWR